MNYELKMIRPGSVFFNALRIFLVVGFLVALLSIFVLKADTRMDALEWWQKLMFTVLYTIVYDLVISAMLTLIAVLYNFWTANYKGISVHFEQES